MTNINFTAFKVESGSLDCDWVEYLDHFGNPRRLFKLHPQDSKVVSVNKQGLILPDTGYSFIKKVTVTNTAATGANEILIFEASSMFAPYIITGSNKYYGHSFLPVRNGKIDWDFQSGREYQNALYPTDVFKCHPASWAVGRQRDDDSSTITSAADSAYFFERNDRGRVLQMEKAMLPYKTARSFQA